MQVMFEYPIGRERCFSLAMPKGAQVLGLVANPGPLGTSHSLAVLVDPNELAGERLSFYSVMFGEGFDCSGLKYLGPLEPGHFLWMSEKRVPVEEK